MRVGEFGVECGGDLGWPEELVFDVDELLCGLDGAEVGLEDAEVASWCRGIDALGHRAHDLQFDRTGGFARDDRGERFAGDFVPAHTEMLGDIADRRPLDLRASVVPAQTCPRRMFVWCRSGRRILR